MVQPNPKRITPHGEKLLEVIRNGDQVVKDFNASEESKQTRTSAMLDREGWMNRSLIAWDIGKKRLTPYDIAMLDLLEAEGLIDVVQWEGYSPHGYTYGYKAK